MKVNSYSVRVVQGRQISFTVLAVNRLNAFRMAIVHPDGCGNSFTVPAGVSTLGQFAASGVLAISRGSFSHTA